MINILLMYTPSPTHEAALRRVAPDAVFHIATDEATARRYIVGADCVLGNRYFLQTLPAARRLRWMQSGSAGVDRILRGAGSMLDGVALTSARDVYSDEIADHALALLLAVMRRLNDMHSDYLARTWQRWSLPSLSGRRVMVLGYGSAGRAIARRLAGFDVSLTGVRRSLSHRSETEGDGCTVVGPDDWRELLPMTDVLMVALPLTSETYHIIGNTELRQLREHAVIVNIARGGLIDEPALFDALREGRLYGAGLDTLTDEPVPPDHPVWDVPSLLLTPHVARSQETEAFRWEALFVENLRRFVAGEPLHNTVDRTRGY